METRKSMKIVEFAGECSLSGREEGAEKRRREKNRREERRKNRKENEDKIE